MKRRNGSQTIVEPRTVPADISLRYIAAGFDVDDRYAGQSEARQHAVTRGDSRVHGAAKGRLEAARRDTGRGQSRAHRLAPEVDDRPLLESAEWVNADASDGDGEAHAG